MSSALKTKLTDKQAEALALVAQLHSTKEIARILEISPRTVEQRIDSARRKLGVASRAEAARIYAASNTVPYEAPCDPSHVAGHTPKPADTAQLVSDLHFRDALVFDERAPWETDFGRPRVKLDIEKFGPLARLAVVVGIAIGFVILVLSVLGIAQGLNDLI